MDIQMLQRRGTAAEWTDENTVLGDGEIGYEKDTGNVKFGDGVTSWTDLPYAFVNETMINAKGDLIVGTADNVAGRLAAGTEGQRLTVMADGTLAWQVVDLSSRVSKDGDTITGRLLINAESINGLSYNLSALELRGDGDGAARISFHHYGVAAYQLRAHTGYGGLQVVNSAGDDYSTFRAGAIFDTDQRVYSPGNRPNASNIDPGTFGVGNYIFDTGSRVVVKRNDGDFAFQVTNYSDQDLLFVVSASGSSDPHSLIATGTNGRLAFGTDDIERMSIDHFGKLTVSGEIVSGSKVTIGSPLGLQIIGGGIINFEGGGSNQASIQHLYNNGLLFESHNSGFIPSIIKGASGQSVPLSSWRTNTDGEVAKISESGEIFSLGSNAAVWVGDRDGTHSSWAMYANGQIYRLYVAGNDVLVVDAGGNLGIDGDLTVHPGGTPGRILLADGAISKQAGSGFVFDSSIGAAAFFDDVASRVYSPVNPPPASISPNIVDALGDLIVGTADNTVGRLARGTTGQRLTVKSDGTLEWQTPVASISPNIVDALGDLIVGTADNTVGRLARGTTGQRLTVQSDGTLAWETPPSTDLSSRVAKTGDTMSGPLILDNQTTVRYSGQSGTNAEDAVFFKPAGNVELKLRKADGTTYRGLDAGPLYDSGNRVYSSGNPPPPTTSLTSYAGHLASDVGSIGTSAVTLLTTSSLSTGTWLISGTGLFVASAKEVLLFIAAGTATVTFDGAAGAQMYMATNGNNDYSLSFTAIATVTGAGTLLLRAIASAASVTAKAVSYGLTGSSQMTGYTAVKIA